MIKLKRLNEQPHPKCTVCGKQAKYWRKTGDGKALDFLYCELCHSGNYSKHHDENGERI